MARTAGLLRSAVTVLSLQTALFLLVTSISAHAQNVKQTPFFRSELIFPLQRLHNHGSCIVQAQDGTLFACWYRGSGERHADDVRVMASRMARGAEKWDPEFVLADTPGFPDTNPCLFIDPRKRLWLFYNTIVNNEWQSALLRVRVAARYTKTGEAPKWDWQDTLLMKPGPEFLARVDQDLARLWEPTKRDYPDRAKSINEYLTDRRAKAADKLSTRLGWMTRAHPTLIEFNGKQRLLVPLYSDLFDFSLIAITDDMGATWHCSTPIVGPGNVQPSIVRRKDGTLVAFFRDNGPPPQRVIQSESTDGGETWTAPHDIALPDPGAGLEAVVLKSGRWVLINNDTEEGRHSLALTVSEDEGRTWLFKKHLERDDSGKDATSYAYPSIIQGKDGMIHASYTFTPGKNARATLGEGESIKHAEFNEAWLLAPEGREQP